MSAGLTRQMRLLGALLRGYPMWAEDWRVPAFHERLRQAVERWRPDIVHFEFHTMGQYADAAVGTITILGQHEDGTLAARDRWRASSGWRKAVYRRDMGSWTKYERDRFARFDAITCFTELDRTAILALRPEARVEVIASRGVASLPAASTQSTDPRTILFVGNFIHPPNVDAAMRLATSIFPLVRDRYPDVKLQLVGNAPPAVLLRLACTSVSVPGRVADVAPWLERATVVAAPLRMGGGLRLKMVQALSFGKAIVGSNLAAEGLELVNGRDAILTDTDADFAESLCALLADPAERQRLAANARAWAERFATPGRVGAAHERLYDSLIR